MTKQIIQYTVLKPVLVEEEVEGLRVTAICSSDDGKLCLEFDCTEALAACSKEDIENIFRANCFGCLETDNLARFYIDTRTNALFTYLHKDESLSFLVELDEASALEWLSVVHPNWLADLIDYGLVTMEEVQNIPLGLSINYWDCECLTNYIHASWINQCLKCGAAQEDQPNSRIEETYQHYLKENI